MFKKNIKKIKSIQWLVIIIFILLYAAFFIPVPYYLTMPGSAIELDTIIEVENGYTEQGELMLTTVSMAPAKIPTLIYSNFDKYMDAIPKEYIMGEDEDPEEYSNRQLKIMKESQDNSIIAAFNYLNYPIEVKEKGVSVTGVLQNSPSEKFLDIGDLITKVDEIDVRGLNDLLYYFETKEAGDIVEVTFIRENKSYTEKIPLVDLSTLADDEDNTSKKIGIGFYPYEEKEVIPSKEVSFNTEDIGGPSAGLMFTLEIINQLTPEDITKGYKIAGTGTIDSEGNIGQIGGAKFKVKAAYKEEAEIFFVPKDIVDEDINQKEAVQTNSELENPMEIVPVSNIEEAMNYLENLEGNLTKSKHTKG